MSSKRIDTSNIRLRVYLQFSASSSETDAYYVLGCASESIDFAKYTMLMRVEDIFILRIDESLGTCIIFKYFYLRIIVCVNVQIPSN